MTGGLYNPGDFVARAQARMKAEADARRAAIEAAEEVRKSIHNEQLKLRATALNVIAVGFVVTGVIGPLTNAGNAVAPASVISEQSLVFMGIWTVLAFILHSSATLILRNLR